MLVEVNIVAALLRLRYHLNVTLWSCVFFLASRQFETHNNREKNTIKNHNSQLSVRKRPLRTFNQQKLVEQILFHAHTTTIWNVVDLMNSIDTVKSQREKMRDTKTMKTQTPVWKYATVAAHYANSSLLNIFFVDELKITIEKAA